jgi:hypothetical protein
VTLNNLGSRTPKVVVTWAKKATGHVRAVKNRDFIKAGGL